MKVAKELQAAIKKHGGVTPVKDHMEEFYERIAEKKRDIASA